MARERCLVEIVLDTGQRYQSNDLAELPARDLARDMRGRAMVVAVTIVDLTTGECATRPSCNLVASGHRDRRGERELLAEALSA